MFVFQLVDVAGKVTPAGVMIGLVLVFAAAAVVYRIVFSRKPTK